MIGSFDTREIMLKDKDSSFLVGGKVIWLGPIGQWNNK